MPITEKQAQLQRIRENRVDYQILRRNMIDLGPVIDFGKLDPISDCRDLVINICEGDAEEGRENVEVSTRHSFIPTVDLRINVFDEVFLGHCLREIDEYLKFQKELVSVEIWCDDKYKKTLCNFISVIENNKLMTLSLLNNQQSINDKKQNIAIVDSLVTLLKSKNNLKRVCLRNYNIGNEGAVLLSSVLGHGYCLDLMSIHSLDELKLDDLKRRPCLIKRKDNNYHIWGNNEGEWKLTALGKLKIPPEWKEGQLVHVSPQEKIWDTLKRGHTLGHDSNLQELSLNSCNIDDSGAKMIAVMLEKNISLKKLDFTGNQISNDGASAFNELLKVNKSLQSINFDLNKSGLLSFKISKETLSNIEKHLQNNKKSEQKMQLINESKNNNNNKETKNQENTIRPAIPVKGWKSPFGTLDDEKYPDKKDSISATEDKPIVVSPEVVIERNSSTIEMKHEQNKSPEHSPYPTGIKLRFDDVSIAVPQRSEITPVEHNDSSAEVKQESSVGILNRLATNTKTWFMNNIWRKPNQFDEPTHNKLQHIAQSWDATDSKRLVDAEVQLNDLAVLFEHKMHGIDTVTLQRFAGRSEEVAHLINKAEDERYRMRELELIEDGDDKRLRDYYYVMRAQLLQTWLACQTIHSKMVADSSTNRFDHIAEGVDYVAKLADDILQRFPGLNLLTQLIKTAASALSYRQKREAVNNMSNLFIGLMEADLFIDVLARQLTLAQRDNIQTEVKPVSTGRLQNALGTVYKGFKKIKNWALVEDIDNETKEFAAQQASKIIVSVMRGEITTPCVKKEHIAQLYAVVMGDVKYQPPVSLTSNLANGSVIPTHTESKEQSSHTTIHSILCTQVQVDDKKDISKIKDSLVDKEKQLQEQDHRIHSMQNRVEQLQQSLEAKSGGVNKEDFDELKAQFDRAQSKDKKNNQWVERKEINNVNKELADIKKNLNQVLGGGSSLQVCMPAGQSDKAIAEEYENTQMRLALMEQQLTRLTDLVGEMNEKEPAQVVTHYNRCSIM